MIYYVDGFTINKNPSNIGGGFVIVDYRNNLIKKEIYIKNFFTNNEGELLGAWYASNIAKKGDTIYTDSRNTISWINRSPTKKWKVREDLKDFALEAKYNIVTKDLKLVWISRYNNLAGIYIENNT